MTDRLKFRAFYKDFPLCDDEKGDYTKSFMIYNVAVYGGCDVGAYLEQFEDSLSEQGFTEEEIEQVRDFFYSGEYEDFINFWADDVEQSTGLKDKNGKLIFDGDVVRINGVQESFEVVYAENLCGLGLKHADGLITSVTPSVLGCVEVVGNIHENHELLEGVK